MVTGVVHFHSDKRQLKPGSNCVHMSESELSNNSPQNVERDD